MRLGKLACRSSLFNDPAVEVGELSVAIRQELAASAARLDALGRTPKSGRQFAPHADVVLAWLRMQMQSVTSDFQAELKQREATISAKESRAARISGVSSVSSPFAAANAPTCSRGGSSRLPKPLLLPVGGVRRRPVTAAGAAAAAGWANSQQPQPPQSHSHLGTAGGLSSAAQGGSSRAPQRVYHDMSGGGFGSTHSEGSAGWTAEETGEPEQMQQFWMPRSQKHRAQEVSQMQSTLAELGSMFQRFGSLVAEQGELLDRLDANTDASVANVEEAHGQILKFQKTVKGNRGLILKTFGVLFFLIIVYGTLR